MGQCAAHDHTILGHNHLSLLCIYSHFIMKLVRIFDLNFFHPQLFAEGKKVKGMVRNDVFWDRVGRFMDFPSIRP